MIANKFLGLLYQQQTIVGFGDFIVETYAPILVFDVTRSQSEFGTDLSFLEGLTVNSENAKHR